MKPTMQGYGQRDLLWKSRWCELRLKGGEEAGCAPVRGRHQQRL